MKKNSLKNEVFTPCQSQDPSHHWKINKKEEEKRTRAGINFHHRFESLIS